MMFGLIPGLPRAGPQPSGPIQFPRRRSSLGRRRSNIHPIPPPPAVAVPLLAGTAFFLCMVLGWLCNLPQRMRKPR